MADHPAFEPLRLGPLSLRNRLIKAATHEGMSVDGLPSACLLRHHREIAAGGVGMTTVAYCAVSLDGRTFSDQLVMTEEAIDPLRAITEAVHEEGAAAMLQLAHCGGFSRNRELPDRPLGPSRAFNAYGLFQGLPLIDAMTEADMQQVVDDSAAAARRALEAGFDAVELHLGHGYLLSQFLSPKLNRRRDAYGGSLDGRMRFPLQVVRAVRDALGDAPLFIKMNLDDGVDGGLHLAQSVELARHLEREGASALVLSGGLVAHSAMYLLRGGRPLRRMIETESNRLQRQALRLFGPVFVERVPFRPLFFLEQAKRVRDAVSLPLVYIGGADTLDELRRARDAGFDLIAMGRSLIHTPDLPARFQAGTADASGCDRCNECIAEMSLPGGVVCAKAPWQVTRRDEEVGQRLHLRVAGRERHRGRISP